MKQSSCCWSGSSLLSSYLPFSLILSLVIILLSCSLVFAQAQSCEVVPWSKPLFFVRGDVAGPTHVQTVNQLATVNNLAAMRSLSTTASLNLADAVRMLKYLFSGVALDAPIPAMDVDGDGKNQINDLIYLLRYLFSGGLAPEGSFPNLEMVKSVESSSYFTSREEIRIYTTFRKVVDEFNGELGELQIKDNAKPVLSGGCSQGWLQSRLISIPGQERYIRATYTGNSCEATGRYNETHKILMKPGTFVVFQPRAWHCDDQPIQNPGRPIVLQRDLQAFYYDGTDMWSAFYSGVGGKWTRLADSSLAAGPQPDLSPNVPEQLVKFFAGLAHTVLGEGVAHAQAAAGWPPQSVDELNQFLQDVQDEFNSGDVPETGPQTDPPTEPECEDEGSSESEECADEPPSPDNSDLTLIELPYCCIEPPPPEPPAEPPAPPPPGGQNAGGGGDDFGEWIKDTLVRPVFGDYTDCGPGAVIVGQPGPWAFDEGLTPDQRQDQQEQDAGTNWCLFMWKF